MVDPSSGKLSEGFAKSADCSPMLTKTHQKLESCSHTPIKACFNFLYLSLHAVPRLCQCNGQRAFLWSMCWKNNQTSWTKHCTARTISFAQLWQRWEKYLGPQKGKSSNATFASGENTDDRASSVPTAVSPLFPETRCQCVVLNFYIFCEFWYCFTNTKFRRAVYVKQSGLGFY